MSQSQENFKMVQKIVIFVIVILNHHHHGKCDNSNIANSQSEQSSTKLCPFSGSKYSVGESWFRRLDTHDLSYCVACNCEEGGKSNCTSRPCNGLLRLCKEASELTFLEKECCQQCQETDFTKRLEIHTKSKIDMDSMPTDILEIQPPSSLTSSSKITCLHNGKIYYDKQVFTSNSSGIHMTQDNQCVQCVCQGGLVLCRLKTCYTKSCSELSSESSNDNYDCCLIKANCQEKPISDEVNYKKESHLVTFFSPDEGSMGSNRQNNVKNCLSAGKAHKHGTTWHPIIGPFGQMDCVICTCKMGNIQCSRIDCPTFNKLPCSNPKKVERQCCAVCPNDNDHQDRMIHTIEQTNVKQDKTDLKIDNPLEGDKKISSVNGESKENPICIPIRMNTIVFKSHAQASNSGYYQYAFQTKGTNRTTYLYSFMVKDDKITDFQEQHLTYEQYKELALSFKFKLIGATKTKFIEKFAKRVKRVPEKCTQKCKSRIERFERTLRLKQISLDRRDLDRPCHSNQTQFY